MPQPFVILEERGPRWDDARSMEEQSDWVSRKGLLVVKNCWPWTIRLGSLG